MIVARAGAADAFPVAAAFATAPAARFSFCLIVENPAAIIVAADLDARRLAIGDSFHEGARNRSENPAPSGPVRHKLDPQPILALEELLLSS